MDKAISHDFKLLPFAKKLPAPKNTQPELPDNVTFLKPYERIREVPPHPHYDVIGRIPFLDILDDIRAEIAYDAETEMLCGNQPGESLWKIAKNHPDTGKIFIVE